MAKKRHGKDKSASTPSAATPTDAATAAAGTTRTIDDAETSEVENAMVPTADKENESETTAATRTTTSNGHEADDTDGAAEREDSDHDSGEDAPLAPAPSPAPAEPPMQTPGAILPLRPTLVVPTRTPSTTNAGTSKTGAKATASSFAHTTSAASSSSANRPPLPSTAARTNASDLHLPAVLIALSSFLWGYGVAVLNVCIVPDAKGSILVDINLTTGEQETATALVLVGALISALTTGGLGQSLGLKTTILVNNVFFLVGGLACALATSKRAIFFGRFCIGLACGIVTNTVPILLNEISPVTMRGQITSYHQLLLTIGMLLTGILGFVVIEDVPSGWRYLNAFIAAPVVLQLLAMAWIPESPWWLMKHKGRAQSRAQLMQLRGAQNRNAVETELSEIAMAMETDSAVRTVNWSDLWVYKSVITMGTVMVFFQAMTGINTVMLYSAKIFHFAGVTNPFLATAVVGVTNVAVTVLSVTLIDKCGRRPLLLYGTVMMILALIVLSLSLLYLDDNLKAQGMIAVASVLVFVAGFAIGLGAAVWVVLADITPVAIRSRAFSVFMGTSYICNIVIAVYTLSAINFLGRGAHPEKNGIAKLYLILAGIASLALIYTYMKVPETGKPKNIIANSEERAQLLLGDEEDQHGAYERTDL